MVAHLTHKLVDPLVIASLRDHRELVSADAENGAMAEDAADDLAGAAKVLIARLMPVPVVHLLQVVHVEDRDGELGLTVLLDLLIQLVFGI